MHARLSFSVLPQDIMECVAADTALCLCLILLKRVHKLLHALDESAKLEIACGCNQAVMKPAIARVAVWRA